MYSYDMLLKHVPTLYFEKVYTKTKNRSGRQTRNALVVPLMVIVDRSKDRGVGSFAEATARQVLVDLLPHRRIVGGATIRFFCMDAVEDSTHVLGFLFVYVFICSV